jgi:hypothetical protein
MENIKRSSHKQLLAISLMLIFFSITASAQKADSIRVEQVGDFIKIGYKIVGSKSGEVYRVRILCSINGGLDSEIRNITGDVGSQVMGGKDEYWAIWDVLKDVEELTSAEFIVRTELVSSVIQDQQEKKGKKNSSTSIIASGFIPGPGYGLRFSVARKVGLTMLFARGPAVILPNPSNFLPSVTLSRASINLTLRISKGDNSELHLLFGPTIGQVLTDQSQNPWDQDWKSGFAPGFEAGAIWYMGKLALSLSGSTLLQTLVEEDPAMSKHTYLTAGIGVRF